MITRVWRGKASAGAAKRYEEFLKRTAYPDYGGVEGNAGWILLRRDLPDCVEFMFVSFWDSMDAVRRYAGGDADQPKYYAEDKAALVELPDRADNFEVVDAQVRF